MAVSLRAWFHEPILNKLLEITMQQDQLIQEIKGLQAQVEKATNEVKTKITALEEAVANNTNVPAEVQAAVADLRATVQSLDDMHADETLVEQVRTEGVQN